MNPLEHELQYPFGDTLPEPGRAMEIAPGLRWVRMGLPFALDHINLWLLRDTVDGRDGWTVVDCGIADDATRAAWEDVIANGLDGLPVVRVLCTHMHPDHLGLADWLVRRFDCGLWMTAGEYGIGRTLATGTRDPEATLRHLRRAGVPDGPMLEAVRARSTDHFRRLVPAVPLAFHRLREDEPVRIGGRHWRVIVGTGHSPEHASLHCCDGPGGMPVLISGDMVLPRISTNVSVFDIEPEADPVNWYLRSLMKYEHCPADTLVLPSHGRPFTGLHVRVRQQVDHHAERLDELLAACRERPMSAHDALAVLFRRELDAHQMMFALGEALAHLHALWKGGKVRLETGSDGVRRFPAA